MDKNRFDKAAQDGVHPDELADMAELDDLFALAQDHTVQPRMDLMDRVLSDALAVQALAQRSDEGAAARRRPTVGFWRSALAALGGWPAMAGLVTASVAGVWIGMNPPEVLSDGAATVLALDSDAYMVDVLPGFSTEIDAALFEG